MKKNTCFLVISLAFLSVNMLAIKPVAEFVNTPSDFGLNYEELSFDTTDNYNISVWHIPPVDNTKSYKNSIIMSYGDMGNKSYWLTQAYYLSYMNFDVWLYDYRGFGNSDAFDIDPDQLYYKEFTSDLEGMVKMVKEKLPDNKITLLSYSMGTIISMLYMNENNSHIIDYYIGDGHAFNTEYINQRIGRDLKLPELGFDYLKVYENIQIPFLIFNGSEDPLMNKDDLEQLQKIKQNISLVEFDGAHLHSFQTLGIDYFKHIGAFLTANE